MEKDCWNCGVVKEMQLSKTLGDKLCIFAEGMMRNPCRGWKPIESDEVESDIEL